MDVGPGRAELVSPVSRHVRSVGDDANPANFGSDQLRRASRWLKGVRIAGGLAAMRRVRVGRVGANYWIDAPCGGDAEHNQCRKEDAHHAT